MKATEVIKNMIDKIAAGDNVSAQDDFESLVSKKLSDAIEAKKQEVAQSIYTGSNKSSEENSEEETEDLEIVDQSTEENEDESQQEA